MIEFCLNLLWYLLEWATAVDFIVIIIVFCLNLLWYLFEWALAEPVNITSALNDDCFANIFRFLSPVDVLNADRVNKG